MSAKTKVAKTKTALKQETYHLNLSDPKHDLHCGFVELGDSASVSQYSVATNLSPIGSTGSNSKSPPKLYHQCGELPP
jgi:hypothetical protein